jgi:hypothetical protein
VRLRELNLVSREERLQVPFGGLLNVEADDIAKLDLGTGVGRRSSGPVPPCWSTRLQAAGSRPQAAILTSPIASVIAFLVALIDSRLDEQKVDITIRRHLARCC